MKVKKIMTYNAETISSEANLIQAAQKMKSFEVGALPVLQEDDLVGMITDRDITIRATAEGKFPSQTFVSEVMSPEVFYCLEDDDIKDAAKIMEEKSVHRLLVFNSDYKPVGFISLSDLAVKSHDEHLTCEVLERISEPACPHR